MGFDPDKRLIVGIDNGDNSVYHIDQFGDIFFIRDIDVLGDIRAMSVSRDGRFIYVIISDNETDSRLIKVDLIDLNSSFEEIPFVGSSFTTSMVLDVDDVHLFGWDKKGNNVWRLNLNTLQRTGLFPLDSSDAILGLYTDSFGDIWGLGSTAFGVASALFKVNKNNGLTDRITSGPESAIIDVTACPYSVQLKLRAESRNIVPCTEIDYTLYVANQSTEAKGVDIKCEFAPGLKVDKIKENTLPEGIRENDYDIIVSDVDLNLGIDSVVIQIEVEDISNGEYSSQAFANNFASTLGSLTASDNPESIKLFDPTIAVLNRLSQDSTLDTFFCIGDSIVLDANIFGNDFRWDNGSDQSRRVIFEAGSYSLSFNNSCIDARIIFEIRTASCPFNVELAHFIEPDTVVTCSEVKFNFALENDSGFTHSNVSLYNELPQGITVVDLIDNPFGGDWIDDDPGVIHIEGMDFMAGIDTISVLCYVDEIQGGDYFNQARISNLPEIIGVFRDSDDPSTQPIDSTKLTVLGIEDDTLEVDLKICSDESLQLDGTLYGNSHSWSTGEGTPSINVEEAGLYVLEVKNGCSEGIIYFNVEPALDIFIIDDANKLLNLGDSITLSPILENFGDSLQINWQPLSDSSTCVICYEQSYFPLRDSTIILQVNNEECYDSLTYQIKVDNTRRIYFSNVFSPNRDGNNDVFFLQSPYYGIINNFEIYDRWGGLVFESQDMIFNDETTGWKPDFDLKSGVYTWYCEITFLDELTESFAGVVFLAR